MAALPRRVLKDLQLTTANFLPCIQSLNNPLYYSLSPSCEISQEWLSKEQGVLFVSGGRGTLVH